MHIITNSCVTAHFVSTIIPIPHHSCSCYIILHHDSTHTLGTMVTKFSKRAPNISASPVWNLSYVTLQVSRFMR